MNARIWFFLFFSVAGCTSPTWGPPPPSVRQTDRRKIDDQLSPERSLKSAAAEDHPEIAVDKVNDDLSQYIAAMKQGKEQPQQVRDKFSTIVQRRRADFRGKVDRLRADYRSAETRRSEDFMNSQRRKRDAYFAGNTIPKRLRVLPVISTASASDSSRTSAIAEPTTKMN